MSKLPVIDLNAIENEDKLYPIVKDILLRSDTFILKNFSNIDSLYRSINILGRYHESNHSDQKNEPNQQIAENLKSNHSSLSLDSNFTGLAKINDFCYMEQYIRDSTNPNIFNTRKLTNSPNNNDHLLIVYEKLVKILSFFTKIALETITSKELVQKLLFDNSNDNIQTENNLPIDITQNHATKFTRYYSILNPNNDIPLDDTDEINEVAVLKGNVDASNISSFSSNNTKDFKLVENSGLMQVFPMAQNIKFKPPTSSLSDNVWSQVVDEPNCLLFHTGKLLQTLSSGLHSTTPLMINYNSLGVTKHISFADNTSSNITPVSDLIYLTIYPDLTNRSVLNNLLIEQINEFPEIAAKYYAKEQNEQKLLKKIEFYKTLFNISETVLSLFSMSMTINSRSKIPELANILPQMTNLLKKKVTQDHFLRMIYIWPEAYTLEIDNKGHITVKLPKQDSLKLLTNNSRKLQFTRKVEEILPKLQDQNLTDVPMFRINKRRSSSSDDVGMKPKTFNPGSNTSINPENFNNDAMEVNYSNGGKYLHNEMKSFKFNEKPSDSQSNLLTRIKEKEAKSKELLQQRQLQHEKFLKMKMKQIWEILKNLQFNLPYTETYLVNLIVDSLRDSNNPIGKDEVQKILFKLYELNKGTIKLIPTENGLKIYRWLNALNDISLE